VALVAANNNLAVANSSPKWLSAENAATEASAVIAEVVTAAVIAATEAVAVEIAAVVVVVAAEIAVLAVVTANLREKANRRTN
jgi:hypothetical protein